MRQRVAALALALAAALGLGACSDDGTTEARKSSPPTIAAVSATQMQAVVDHVVAPDPTVRVTDAAGRPLRGFNVLFFIGGNAIPPVTTGADGLASVTWRLPQQAGTQTLTARIYDPARMTRPADVTFTAIALPDTLAAIRPYTVATQLGFRAHPAPTSPVVVAVDEYSNAKPGVEVRFEVTGGGSVTPERAVTDSEGRATVSSWMLGGDFGIDTLIARVGNLEPIYFTAQVAPALLAKSIVSGNQHTCAIVLSGDVYCWGNNLDGAVNPGNPTRDFAVPQRVGLPGDVGLPGEALSIAGGYAHSCAIVDMTPSRAYCWGLNTSGQLGIAAQAVGAGPVLVPVPDGLVAVATGFQHSCGLTPAGVAFCWGDGTWGQLGTGEITSCSTVPTSAMSNCPGPKPVAGDLRFVAIAAGDYHTCGLVASGQLYCWGLNSRYQLGSPSGSPCSQVDDYYYYYYDTYPVACALAPQLVLQAPAFTAVAAGVEETCGLAASGSVSCYGPPGGTQFVSNAPPFASLSPDANCGIGVDGAAYCWNRAFDVQTASAARPDPLASAFAFSAITAVHGHRCGILKTDGTAVCWGANESGELGNGSRLSTAAPSPVLSPLNPQ